MTIIFTDGSITTSASEQTIVDLTANEHFAFWLFLHNMTASETFRIKVYVKDQNLVTMRLYTTVDISGVQSDPAYFIPFVAAKQYKVTIQRTGGSDRAVTWQSIEVS